VNNNRAEGNEQGTWASAWRGWGGARTRHLPSAAVTFALLRYSAGLLHCEWTPNTNLGLQNSCGFFQAGTGETIALLSRARVVCLPLGRRPTAAAKCR